MMVCSLQPPSLPISSSRLEWQPSLVHRPSMVRATVCIAPLVRLSCSCLGLGLGVGLGLGLGLGVGVEVGLGLDR